MYRCQATNVQVPAKQPACRLITHIRPKTYYRINHKTGLEEVVGQGTEIVREILASREYYNHALATGFQPELVKTADSREPGFFNRVTTSQSEYEL